MSDEPNKQPDESKSTAPVAGTAQEHATPAAGEDLFDPTVLPTQDKSALLTALLFSSGEVVPLDRLAEYLGLDAGSLSLLAEEFYKNSE